MRDPFKKLLNNVRSTRRVRPTCESPLPIEITVDDLKELFRHQEGRCAILGTKLDPYKVFVSNHPLAPSVDRLDNTKGYTLDNIQICSRFANFGKCSYPHEQMGPVVEQIKEGFVKKSWWSNWL